MNPRVRNIQNLAKQIEMHRSHLIDDLDTLLLRFGPQFSPQIRGIIEHAMEELTDADINDLVDGAIFTKHERAIDMAHSLLGD